jgi:hypothetical protein
VEQAERDSGVTLAELLAAFSLATDLGLDAALGGPGDFTDSDVAVDRRRPGHHVQLLIAASNRSTSAAVL